MHPSPSQSLPYGVSAALTKLSELKGYNLTIGNDGSVEIIKNHEVIHSEVIPESKGMLVNMVAWLNSHAAPYIPKGLKIHEPDLSTSIFTMTLPGGLLGRVEVKKFTAGVYGSSVSPEASRKGGYLVFKPET